MTALTWGCAITSSLLPLWTSASAASASARARAGSRSETARNRTAGCLAASRARSVPMRPAPITAMPIWSCFIRCPSPALPLRHLPHRDLVPIASHALLVDVDAEPRAVGDLDVSAHDAHGLRGYVLGEALIGQRKPPGNLR